MNTRITPLEAPFEEETAEILAAMMPPGAPPIDVCMLAGWYHAISYAANASRVPFENGAPRFDDYRQPTKVI